MQGRSFTVLLVEDNQAHAELIIRGFERQLQPCRVHRAKDGESALDYLFRRGSYVDPQLSVRPDLVLLDLRLPRVDGFEVLNQIKNSETLRTIPVVVLTTSAAETDIEKAYACRANSYLIKPVGFQDFSQLIDALADYWLNWNFRAWASASKQGDIEGAFDSAVAASDAEANKA